MAAQTTSPIIHDLYQPITVGKPFKKMPDVKIPIQGTMGKTKTNRSTTNFGPHCQGSPAHHEEEYSPIQYLLLTIFTVAAILFMFRAFLILR